VPRHEIEPAGRGSLAVAALAMAGLGSAARAEKPAGCQGSFIVSGEPIFGTAPTTIELGPEGVSIRGICGAKKPRLRARPEGTRMRVQFRRFCPANVICGGPDFEDALLTGPRWLSLCDEIKGVKIEPIADASCETLSGSVRARRPRIDREFVATLAPAAAVTSEPEP
jgi:hypothetical protein